MTFICSNIGMNKGSVFRITIHFFGKMVNFYTICTKRIVKNDKIRHKLWFFCRFTSKIWYNTSVKNLFISNTLNRRIFPLGCGISKGGKNTVKKTRKQRTFVVLKIFERANRITFGVTPQQRQYFIKMPESELGFDIGNGTEGIFLNERRALL